MTADDGGLGEQYLCDFQDNEKTTPTILTTSQKLSPGVDARNIRNIILSLLNTGMPAGVDPIADLADYLSLIIGQPYSIQRSWEP